jgi:hypothetical protein
VYRGWVYSITGKVVCIVSHRRCERLLQAWLEAGGTLDESIEPKAFLRAGIAPGGFRDDLVLAAGDGADAADADDYDDSDADDAQPTADARPAPRSRSTSVPWNSRPIEPKHNAAQRDLWTQSLGGPRDAMGPSRDPLDLRPEVPLKKRSQSWSNTILQPLKEGR